MTNHLLKATAASAGIILGLAAAGTAWAQDAVNLRMTIWSANEAHLAMFNSIAEGFKTTHPNVSVTFEPLPFDSYTTTLTTQIAGGNPPDLAWILETTAADFVNSGALAPLTDAFAATEGYDLADVSEKATALWTKDGQLYAYPFSTSPFAIFANNDVLKAAGAKTPAELIAAGEWNWDNAFASAATVGQSGKTGLVVRDFKFQTWQNLASIWNGWGAAPWSADGKTCTFTDPAMVDALTAIHKAVFTDKAMPGPGEDIDFFAGETGMTITQISRASLLPKENPFDWDLVPLPAGPAGEYSVVGQAGVGAFARLHDQCRKFQETGPVLPAGPREPPQCGNPRFDQSAALRRADRKRRGRGHHQWHRSAGPHQLRPDPADHPRRSRRPLGAGSRRRRRTRKRVFQRQPAAGTLISS
jgi:multiple sugar transport system substrate-binding protein